MAVTGKETWAERRRDGCTNMLSVDTASSLLWEWPEVQVMDPWASLSCLQMQPAHWRHHPGRECHSGRAPSGLSLVREKQGLLHSIPGWIVEVLVESRVITQGPWVPSTASAQPYWRQTPFKEEPGAPAIGIEANRHNIFRGLPHARPLILGAPCIRSLVRQEEHGVLAVSPPKCDLWRTYSLQRSPTGWWRLCPACITTSTSLPLPNPAVSLSFHGHPSHKHFAKLPLSIRFWVSQPGTVYFTMFLLCLFSVEISNS